MSYRRKLYKLIESFTLQKRPNAYKLGCNLFEENETVTTVAGGNYKVWVELSSPVMPRSIDLIPRAEMIAPANHRLQTIDLEEPQDVASVILLRSSLYNTKP